MQNILKVHPHRSCFHPVTPSPWNLEKRVFFRMPVGRRVSEIPQNWNLHLQKLALVDGTGWNKKYQQGFPDLREGWWLSQSRRRGLMLPIEIIRLEVTTRDPWLFPEKLAFWKRPIAHAVGGPLFKIDASPPDPLMTCMSSGATTFAMLDLTCLSLLFPERCWRLILVS